VLDEAVRFIEGAVMKKRFVYDFPRSTKRPLCTTLCAVHTRLKRVSRSAAHRLGRWNDGMNMVGERARRSVWLGFFL